MPGPRVKFRERPKKMGARKRVRTKSQKKRLFAAGLDEKYVNKLTAREIRDELKKAARKKSARKSPVVKKKSAAKKKPIARKKSVARKKPVVKKKPAAKKKPATKE
ncbi:MAG: hypothetical protein KJ995_06275 [Candidatus Omnitrophica bacterium]|nr:hypothetical protein [Candidatus Omnitrophota bacterium]MBU1127956.1 hypothetical protein [Candidatus Omnitrophota bacterium]MBU1784603.1 hypothetical protein [Candidatus Omnitrophota bacterium]MBU1851991.1 hypothetical protein [Candidatus Omnitrophota bacterium]